MELARTALHPTRDLRKKQGLTFTILSDTELEAIKAYDVWKEKKNYGKYQWELSEQRMSLMKKG